MRFDYKTIKEQFKLNRMTNMIVTEEKVLKRKRKAKNKERAKLNW